MVSILTRQKRPSRMVNGCAIIAQEEFLRWRRDYAKIRSLTMVGTNCRDREIEGEICQVKRRWS